MGSPAGSRGEDLPCTMVTVPLDDGIHVMGDGVDVADPAEVVPGSGWSCVNTGARARAPGSMASPLCWIGDNICDRTHTRRYDAQ